MKISTKYGHDFFYRKKAKTMRIFVEYLLVFRLFCRVEMGFSQCV